MSRMGKSIYKRKDGRWEARYIHHYENGKAKYRFLYASTYSGVRDKLFAELEDGEFLSSPLPIKLPQFDRSAKSLSVFSEISRLWLAEVKNSVKESTYARYYRIVEKYLNPALAEIPVVKLDFCFFKSFSFDLLNKGGIKGTNLSPKTVTDVLCVLKTIFRYGKRNGYPCTDIGSLPYPAKSKKPAEILTVINRDAIESELLNPVVGENKDRVSLGIIFTLYTGVRIGELCGLKFEDIDFKANTVKIKRTVERIANLESGAQSKTKLIISEPKTESSIRVIPLPSFLAEYVKQFHTDSGSYLLTGTEKPTEPHQFYLRYRTYMRRLGMDVYTFHALRHTFATRCVENGFDPKSLSEILGHSNVLTTMSLYVHPTLEQKRRQMETLTPDIFLHPKM